ncbi:MAG TPA: zinc ribbon domain-containing protein [Verrucomicrobiae bacterium]|jgi:hypothetical protein|nr:zinc ribbon domain-containing protein [Verrucomicrobiae bacterium]
MDQPCYKCGAQIEEGIAFCPHCGAPQIRVILPEPMPNLAVAGDAVSGTTALPAAQTAPVLAVPMRWSGAVRPCAIAALIAALAMVLKLMVPVIAALGAGFLAVAFYRRRNPEVLMSASAGARLGALCGIFCFGMTAVFEALAVAILNKGDEIRRTMLDAIQQTAARYPDPQFQAGLDFMRSPAGLVFMMVCALFFGFLLFLVLGTAGGALGGAAFGRRPKS